MLSWGQAFKLLVAGLAVAGFIALWQITGNADFLLGLLTPFIERLLSAIGRLRKPRPEGPEDLIAQAVKQVNDYWAQEASRRETGAKIMPSRWRLASSDRWAEGHLPAEGNLNELVESYAAHPFRLLLLGERGSGKTRFCVQLVSRLAQGRPEKVPALFTLGSWNRGQPLDDWMAEQLHATLGLRRDLARQLVTGDHLLPILDGLDEGPGHDIADSLQKIARSRAGRGPMVLTCLDSAFDERDVDHLFGRDAEVRLLPLSADEIADVLTEHSQGRPSWARVIGEVRGHPEGPLAEALNTRLMLFLAIDVFSKTPESPQRLVTDPGLRTADDIRNLITGLFLDTALADSPVREFRDPRRTNRWLTFIAASLYSSDMRLSWWRFFEYFRGTLIFPAVRVAVGATVTAALCLLLFGLFGYPIIGLIFGALLGGAGGVAMSLPGTADPRALPTTLRKPEGPAPAVLSSIVTGVGGAVALGFLYGDALVGLLTGLALGLGFGVVRRMLTAEQPTAVPSLDPDQVLRDDRRVVVHGFFLGALVSGAVGAALGLLRRVEELGMVIEVPTPASEVLLGATVGAICGAFALAMTLHATSAWGRFILTRALLAVRDDVPWRLMTFLRVAADAGIFRRLGPQYEFRNELFRTYLLSRRNRATPGE